jgi:hypothetical protein
MTWNARFAVQEVNTEESPAVIRATADAGQVSSNTEGKIVGAELTLRLDETDTSVRVGDEITANGHFVGTGAAE